MRPGIIRKTLGSVHFAIALLMVIAAAAVWGSVISSDPERGAALARARVFNSWWYTLLLALLGVNLGVCSWRRLKSLISQLRRAPFQRDAAFYTASEVTETLSWKTSTPPHAGIGALEQVVRKSFRFCRSDTDALYARKGVAACFGSLIVHLGVIVILLGGLVRYGAVKLGWAVFDGRMVIPEGESANSFYVAKDPQQPISEENLKTIALGFELRCLDFREEKFPASAVPRYYESLVQLDDGGRPFVFQITMRTPLNYGGYKFHQLDFRENPDVRRARIEIRDGATGRAIADLDVSPHAPARIPNSDLMIELDGFGLGDAWRIFDPRTLKTLASATLTGATMEGTMLAVTEFLPDFRLDEHGVPSSASDEPRNPAVQIVVLHNGAERSRGWLFQRPEFHSFSTMDDPEFDFAFLDYNLGGIQDEPRPRFRIALTSKNTEHSYSELVLEQDEWKTIGTQPAEHQTQSTAARSSAPYDVRILAPAVGYETILGVTRDPSIWLSYAGGILLIVGILVAFLIPYRQLWMYLDPKEQSLRVALRARGGLHAAPREFRNLLAHVENRGLAVRNSKTPDFTRKKESQ